jgi:hypothetical protein
LCRLLHGLFFERAGQSFENPQPVFLRTGVEMLSIRVGVVDNTPMRLQT